MKWLVVALLLISTPALAETSMVRIFWEYDTQDQAEYAIDTVTVEVDGEQKCSDDSPVIDTSTGYWHYSCPWDSFTPGTYQARLIFTDVSGFNTYTNYEEITIPEIPPELPDRIDPVITGHEVIET